MDTNEEKKNESQDDEGGMTKYAVECKCAEGKRPANESMEKRAQGYKCPSCGRLHPLDQ